MKTFLSIHQDKIVGTLSMFDRMIFKGYLTGFFPKGAFGAYLWRKGVLLKDFGNYVEERTQTLKAHLEGMAQAAYLSSSKESKEELARAIAERDGITEGLVCIFSVLESCMSFDVRGNHQTHKLEVVRRQRKCLHYYAYYLDREFGLMHLRLQSWFPFDLQIYVNGREWLARTMGAAEAELANIRRGALLHDIGKMGVPDSILLKPDKLTDEEWETMRKHPMYAYEMLSPIHYLRPALDIPYCHHEKWDGSGYPRGLQGEGIPLAARIFAVVDVWDALTSDRPYRKAWKKENALEYIREQAGKHFDTRLERDVALKIIRTEQFAQAVLERILKRFEREAKALARLTHPNIVPVIDYGEHEGAPYLVMPYLPGGTLKQKLGRPMPWQDAVRLLMPVAQALEYAHEQGIVHRDVKPSNILITKSGEPTLSDFGIAKILESEETISLTGTGVGVGTPEYMSPEQGLGKGIDARADIYSLGIVFYEMVTGRKPFTADTPMAVVIKHISEPLPRPSRFVPGLPVEVERVLLKALAKQPENRYPDMGVLTKALEFLLAAPAQVSGRGMAQVAGEEATRDLLEPVAGQKPRAQGGLRKWLPFVGIATVLCIALAAGGGYLIWRSINGTAKANPLGFSSVPTASTTQNHLPEPTYALISTTTSPISCPTFTSYPTYTPYPTNTHVSPTDTVIAHKDPGEFIRYYFNAINNRQYNLSWSLLDDKFRQKFNPPEQGGYDGYVAYWDSIQRVDITSVTLQSQTASRATVLARGTFYYKDGRHGPAEMHFYLEYDTGRGTWLFTTNE